MTETSMIMQLAPAAGAVRPGAAGADRQRARGGGVGGAAAGLCPPLPPGGPLPAGAIAKLFKWCFVLSTTVLAIVFTLSHFFTITCVGGGVSCYCMLPGPGASSCCCLPSVCHDERLRRLQRPPTVFARWKCRQTS